MVFADIDKAKEVWLTHLANLEKQGAKVTRQEFSLYAVATWAIYVEVAAVVPHKHGWEVRTTRINMSASTGGVVRTDTGGEPETAEGESDGADEKQP